MKATINPLLEQTCFDSAAPNGAAAVIHKFGDPGEYIVRFIAGDASFAHVRLTVGSDPPTGIASPPDGIAIDLAKIEYSAKMGGAEGHEDPFVVRPKGYVAFSASTKAKSYAVVAEPATDSKGVEQRTGFDSRRLGPDDIFTVTLMRPGDYRVVNEFAKYEGLITVAYPVIGDRPYRPPEPQQVEVNQGGFDDQTAAGARRGFQYPYASTDQNRFDPADDGPKGRPSRKVGISPEAIRERVERWRQEQEKKRKKS